jgi:hypothetical protein
MWLEIFDSLFKVSKSAPFHTPHVFDFLFCFSKVSKSAAFHTPHGYENLSVKAKSASQQLFTHHIVGKCRLFV